MEILSLEWKMSSIFHVAGYWTYCLTDRGVVRGVVQVILVYVSADAMHTLWRRKQMKEIGYLFPNTQLEWQKIIIPLQIPQILIEE